MSKKLNIDMRTSTARIFLLAVLLGHGIDVLGDPGDSTRSRRWYLPHYVPLQFAGNIGFVSIGAGYISSHRNYRLELLYGYVPKTVAGAYIHHITAKNIFTVGRYLL